LVDDWSSQARFHWIIVESRDFCRAHTWRGVPLRNMHVAEALDVIERLASACAGKLDKKSKMHLRPAQRLLADGRG